MQEMLGMSPREALRATTLQGAALLGIRRGTLAAGEVADLMLLRDEIESDARPYRSPIATVKSGVVFQS
jgi:imidazolonepropionase-like amidohydrolase